MADTSARLELRDISKRFPGVLANDHVSLTVKPGEIHALLGENGAGKSTLVKMIYGITAPDSGQIIWNGQPVRVQNPKAARRGDDAPLLDVAVHAHPYLILRDAEGIGGFGSGDRGATAADQVVEQVQRSGRHSAHLHTMVFR